MTPSLAASDGRASNEGNDTIRGSLEIDTISGGAGSDVFAYSTGSNDGNNVAAGGPTELITDFNWAEDRFEVPTAVAFAGATTPGAAANLLQAATNAIASVWAANGSPQANVAAQFDFGGRTFVAINQGGGLNTFDEANDLLIDITGAVGSIGASSFIT
jgi:Ca2+-binding RTX toxin-like protein